MHTLIHIHTHTQPYKENGETRKENTPNSPKAEQRATKGEENKYQTVEIYEKFLEG